jgi:hypothetical protein
MRLYAESRELLHEKVVLLADPTISLVSMANSGGISKRPILPASTQRTDAAHAPRGTVQAGAFCTGSAIPGATVPGNASTEFVRRSDSNPAPPVGGPGGLDQRIAQLT